jgi:hypothetical protein
MIINGNSPKKKSTIYRHITKNLLIGYENKKRLDYVVHVSDIIPSTCMRKQYYSRKSSDSSFSLQTLNHFIRGEASEYGITRLATLGIAQHKIEMEDIVGHPDIMNENKN